MSKYLDLAKEQFFAMKEDILDEDRQSLGGAIEKEHEVDGKKCKIKVDGFWEKSNWFEWEAVDMSGSVIEKGFWD